MLRSLQRLARFLDRPLFPWKKLIVGFSLAQYLFEGFLSLRQYQVLKQTRPPKVLQSEVSQEVFDKSQVCIASSPSTTTASNILRLMAEPKQSSVSSAVSTAKFKTQHSYTMMFYPNSGHLPAHGSCASRQLDFPARFRIPSSSF